MHDHHKHHHNHDESGRRARRRPDGRGPEGGFGGLGEFAGAFGPGFGGPRGRRGRGPGGRARRGDVRTAVIALLNERPMHGYEIIQELAERTNGVWKPSPGSVYPTLQMLQDEGHITAEEDAGKRQFTLTDSGRALAGEMEGKKTPWEEVTEEAGPDAMQLRDGIRQLIIAAAQIGKIGSPEQQTQAVTILAESRRRLYAILAAEA